VDIEFSREISFSVSNPISVSKIMPVL
jgi:hypothetical protein